MSTRVSDNQRLELIDREAQSPLLAGIMHVGAPLIISVLIHTLLIGATGLVVLTSGRDVAQTLEYEATINTDAGEAVALIEDKPQQLDFQEVALAPLDISALSAPTAAPDIADLQFDEPTSLADALGGGGGPLGGGAGLRRGLLGVGSGSVGGGGLGTGLGTGLRLGRAGLWNVEVSANRVAYVVDFSGSLVTLEDALRRHLKRSVGELRESQSFNVVLFYGTRNQRPDAFQSKLIPATADNKRAFFEWIEEKSATGRTEPLPAVRKALGDRPEAIFFISDGRFPNEFVDEITQLNRNTSAQFACFLFDEAVMEETSDLPARPSENAARLERLAEQNLGRSSTRAYRTVTIEDLFDR